MYEIQRSSQGLIPAGREPGALFGNRLLDHLPKEESARLAPYLRRVFLHRGQELYAPGDAIDYLYFSIDALIWSWSLTTNTERPTSLFAVGRRGVAGFARALNMPFSDAHVAVLSPGGAWRMHCSALDAFADHGQSALMRVLLRFGYAAFAIGCARLACNSEHNVDKRLARWLLWIVDETGKPEVTLTHQQLADVAAIRRPSVSLAFSDLQRRGVVRLHHGLVQILDRERLEHEACHCYVSIRELVENVERLRPVPSTAVR